LFQKAQNHASQIKTLKCVLTEYSRFLFRLKTATRGDGGEVCCGGGAGNGGLVTVVEALLRGCKIFNLSILYTF
jgi:hypothetical protein